MHEAAICEALLDQVEREARRARAGAAGVVRKVTVSVGALSGVSPEALAVAFDVMRPGRLPSCGPLEITRVAALLSCRACGRSFSTDDPFGVCDSCGARDVAVSGGDALSLDSIEIE